MLGMRTRALIPSLLAALALAAAGCGGSKTAGSSTGSSESGASLVPATAPAFVSVNSDLSSDQWKQLETLSDKFPGKAKLIADAKASMQKDGVNWDTDVKPALGPEIDIALLSLQNGGNDFVVLTQPKDEAKLNAALAKGSPPHPVHEDVNGWTVYSDKQATLDTFKSASSGDKLADQSAFKDAMATLSSDAIAKAYVNGTAVQQTVKSSTSVTRGIDTSSLFGSLQWLAADALAQGDGVKFQVNVKGSNSLTSGKAYTAELAKTLPSGALAYFSFNDLSKAIKNGIDQAGKSVPNFEAQKAQMEQALGFSIDNDLLPLFANEGAIAVYPGTPIPTIDVVLTVKDEAKAQHVLDRVSALANLAGGSVKAKSVQVGGLSAKELNFGQFSIVYATFDGKLAISSTEAGLAVLHAGGNKLADDQAYKDARTGAGAPDSTNGFFYLNLRDSLSSLLGLASLSGSVPSAQMSQVQDNTRPLQSLFVYSTTKDGITSGTGFLGFK